MRPKSPRVAVRAILVHEHRLLLVNAWPDGKSPLMCAPGGGVNVGQSLPDNLIREVKEETGLDIQVGAPCLVNEFHDPPSGFHQVEIFFRATLISSPMLDPAWRDPEAVVTDRRWATHQELQSIPHKPSSLGQIAFETGTITYDPLETLVR